MQKLDNLLGEYNPCLYPILPKFLKKRLNALKKIQLERIQVELEYHKEIQALELKYAKLFEPFNERRAKIISGEYTPTDEECQLPSTIVEEDFDGENQENNNEIDKESLTLTEAEEEELADKVKGLPSFWLCVLLSSSSFIESIEPQDKPVLKHLNDIRVSYEKSADNVVIHTIEFQFDENPYFTNKTLIKKYHLKLKPDEKDPFSFDGHELVNIEGQTIDWIPGKDPTLKTVTVKQKNKNDGSIRTKTKSVERDSFFHFFTPPPFSSNKEDGAEADSSALASLDFELAELIRQNLVPKAVLYLTGDLVDDELEDDKPYDDDDDSFGDDSETDNTNSDES